MGISGGFEKNLRIVCTATAGVPEWPRSLTAALMGRMKIRIFLHAQNDPQPLLSAATRIRSRSRDKKAAMSSEGNEASGEPGCFVSYETLENLAGGGGAARPIFTEVPLASVSNGRGVLVTDRENYSKGMAFDVDIAAWKETMDSEIATLQQTVGTMQQELANVQQQLAVALECQICFVNREDKRLSCGHRICTDCANNNVTVCPFCHATLKSPPRALFHSSTAAPY